MLVHRTGGRYDGRTWCGYRETIDLPQWEADDLIREGLAEYPDKAALDRGYDVLKVAATDYESHLKPVGGEYPGEDPRYAYHPDDEEPAAADDFDSDFDRGDGDSDFERAPAVKRPYANANKSEWIDYVVESGFISYGDAKNMTKAALMEMDS